LSLKLHAPKLTFLGPACLTRTRSCCAASGSTTSTRSTGLPVGSSTTRIRGDCAAPGGHGDGMENGMEKMVVGAPKSGAPK
jgi:hypothetical protein